MLADVRLGQYLEELGSDRPTPGGGSAGAVVASLGASLGLMALRLAQRRAESGSEQAMKIGEWVQEGEELRQSFLELAQADGEAYAELSRVRAALRQGGQGAEDWSRAVERAVRVPLQLGREAVQGLDLMRRILSVTSPMVAPDVYAGSRFLHAALRGAWSNVRVNLAEVNDGVLLQEARENMEVQSREAAVILAGLDEDLS